MEVQTYRAHSISEALRLVREQLGPDVDVLGSRSVPVGGWLGFLRGKRGVEVQVRAEQTFQSRLRHQRKLLDQGIDLCGFGGKSSVAADGSDRLLKSLLEQLQAAHVDRQLASELVDRASQDCGMNGMICENTIRSRMVDLLATRFNIAEPVACRRGYRRTIAMVGPTGVGKTTTTAKLAAYFHLHEGLNVGLIAADTYRVAAVDQLRSYGEIMGLPVRVASSTDELREALAVMNELDLVLIDTAGCMPDDAEKAGALRATLKAAAADDVYLVLSGTGASASLANAVEHFTAVGATALVLTKLDETPSTGHLLPLVHSGRLPLSYVTNGQNVPDDVLLPNCRWLAELMLGFAT